MKTKKSVWSIVLSLILVLALALSIGLGIQKSTVNAQNGEHITFNVLVDDEAYKSVSSTYSGQFTVSYYVTESTGVDALQLKLGYDHEKFTLVSVVTNDETALGAATKGVENYLDNVVYDNTNKNGAVLVLNSEDESILLITAVFEVKEGATLVKGAEYEFGFYNVNDTEEEDTYSTAWRIEKDAENPENPSTHEKVEILFANIAKIITKASIRPILTGIVRNYNGQYAQNSEITINLANAYQNFSEIEQYDLIPEEICPGIDEIAWFEAYETEYNNYVRYRKLSGTPKDAGTYYVAIRTSENDYFEAYCGWALEDQELFGEGAYGLDAWAVGNWSGVATYVINPLAITITMDNQTSAYGDAIVSPLTYTQTGTIVEGENLHFIPSTTATSESDVGTYPITMVHDNNSNYNVTVNNGVYTITQKAITITALDQSAKYTGSEPEVDQSKYSVEGVDSISGVVITKAPGVTVGTYTLTPSYTNTNYSITFVNGTFTITLSDLTQEQLDNFVAQNVIFYARDNDTDHEIAIENRAGSYIRYYNGNQIYVGAIVNGNSQFKDYVDYKLDLGSVERIQASGMGNFADYNRTNAGTYVAYITFLPNDGYAFAQGVNATYTVTFTINRVDLTITASGSAQYGDVFPAITIDNGTGWVGSENYATYNTNVQALEEYVDSSYDDEMTAGTHYSIIWDSDAEDEIEAILTNYNVTLVGADCVVAKKVLNAADYAFAGYTGTYDAANHTLAVTGNLDLVNVTISSKATVKNVADSGNYTATIALKDAANYTFENGTNTGWTVAEGYASASKQAAVSITAKQLTINIAYEKTTATFTLSGFAGSETEAVLNNLAYTADKGQSYCINGNVFTVDNEVDGNVTISATSENTNYTIKSNQLRKIIIVGYLAGTYDVNISGATPVLPSNDVFFAGFTTVEPEPVELNHYTFKCFATDGAGNNPFNYSNVVNESTAIYVTWDLNDKYSITLYYMVEGNAEDLHQVGEVLSFYDDVAIRYNNELPAMQANAWFRTQEWYTNTELTTKFVSGSKLSGNITLYANYVFNIGLGDVNGNGSVNANDITLYREWIVGGYEMTEVEVGEEWATVTAQEFDAQNVYFIKRVADSNAQSVESTILGDNSLDIRDVSTIRMAMVGGYGFSILEGKYVDGEEIIVTKTVTTDNASDLLILAKSGVAVELNDDITEEDFVGAIENASKDIVIDLKNHELTVKSLSISLAAENTGKIEIKNGRINVADGNGVHLSAPAGSIVLDNVTLYDKNGEFNLQAADHSLHFYNVVKFLKDEQGVEAPATVKVEKDTHIVVEKQAEVAIEKIVVTEEFIPVDSNSEAEISITIRNEQEEAIVVEGNFRNDIASLSDLIAAAQKGGEYTLIADISYNGCLGVYKDFTLNLNGHTLRSANDSALCVGGEATLTINGEGNVIAQEVCVLVVDGSTAIINGGTYTTYDNFVVGTNGSNGRGNNTITINGGVFNGNIQSAGYVACGIYVANSDTVVVNAGEFNITNGVGILARSGNTTVAEDVVFNVTGNGELGKVGDSKVTVPAGEALVIDCAANYPGGAPVLVNNNSADVYALVDDETNLNAVKNVADKIVLAKDIEITNNQGLTFAKDMVLDLNGKNVRFAKWGFEVINDATLTINGNGTVSAVEAALVAQRRGHLVVNGGTFSATDNFVVGTQGSAGNGENTITINGGVFNGSITSAGYVACGIYVANNDTVVVNAGEFNITNGVGILARSGNTTVAENVVFNVTGDGHLGKVGDSKVTVPAGEKLVLDLKAGYPGGVPTINNNTLNDVYVVVDGTYTFASDDASFHAARGVYDNVILTGDFDDYLYVTKDMNIYLNGHTVDASSTSYVAIYVVDGAKVTINGNGNVVATEGCVLVTKGSELVVNGGTYTCYDNFVIGTNGSTGYGENTITINGGVFNGYIKSAGYVACGIYVANSDTVVVNAGEFNITNGCGILARSGNTIVNNGVVFNVTGNGELGKVGDSKVTVPAGEELVLDLAANYPGGAPSLVNNSTYTVYTIGNGGVSEAIGGGEGAQGDSGLDD